MGNDEYAPVGVACRHTPAYRACFLAAKLFGKDHFTALCCVPPLLRRLCRVGGVVARRTIPLDFRESAALANGGLGSDLVADAYSLSKGRFLI